jgi:hypothetical protein
MLFKFPRVPIAGTNSLLSVIDRPLCCLSPFSPRILLCFTSSRWSLLSRRIWYDTPPIMCVNGQILVVVIIIVDIFQNSRIPRLLPRRPPSSHDPYACRPPPHPMIHRHTVPPLIHQRNRSTFVIMAYVSAPSLQRVSPV